MCVCVCVCLLLAHTTRMCHYSQLCRDVTFTDNDRAMRCFCIFIAIFFISFFPQVRFAQVQLTRSGDSSDHALSLPSTSDASGSAILV